MEPELNGFTVFALTFGDHDALIHRCLGSIATRFSPQLVRSVRVGLNAASERSRGVVYGLLRTLASGGVHTLAYDSPVNRLKYPMMRKMFHDPAHPVLTPYTMWFDDDSCLTPRADPSWWSTVYGEMADADMLGSVWHMPLQGRQCGGVMAQPWYAGRSPAGRRARFATGGWWCCRTRVLQEWDYPFRDLKHNGGDVMLGELLYQRGLRLKNFGEAVERGVWVNADDQGRPSKAPRRGESQKPVWYNWGDGAARDYSHHDFEVAAVDPAADNFVNRAAAEAGLYVPPPAAENAADAGSYVRSPADRVATVAPRKQLPKGIMRLPGL